MRWSSGDRLTDFTRHLGSITKLKVEPNLWAKKSNKVIKITENYLMFTFYLY